MPLPDGMIPAGLVLEYGCGDPRANIPDSYTSGLCDNQQVAVWTRYRPGKCFSGFPGNRQLFLHGESIVDSDLIPTNYQQSLSIMGHRHGIPHPIWFVDLVDFLTSDGIPGLHGIATAGEQGLPIVTQAQRVDFVSVAYQCKLDHSLTQIPDLDGIVISYKKCLSILVGTKACHRIVLSRQCLGFFSRLQIPDLNASVLTAGAQSSIVPAELEASYSVAMPSESVPNFVGLKIPNLDSFVLAARVEDLRAGIEAKSTDGSRMPFECQVFAIGQIMNLNIIVIACCV